MQEGSEGCGDDNETGAWHGVDLVYLEGCALEAQTAVQIDSVVQECKPLSFRQPRSHTQSIQIF
jgi:hypothetical protein